MCHFAYFLGCVHGVFNSPVATPAYGLLGLRPSFRLQFLWETANLLALYVCSTTQGRSKGGGLGAAGGTLLIKNKFVKGI